VIRGCGRLDTLRTTIVEREPVRGREAGPAFGSGDSEDWNLPGSRHRSGIRPLLAVARRRQSLVVAVLMPLGGLQRLGTVHASANGLTGDTWGCFFSLAIAGGLVAVLASRDGCQQPGAAHPAVAGDPRLAGAGESTTMAAPGRGDNLPTSLPRHLRHSVSSSGPGSRSCSWARSSVPWGVWHPSLVVWRGTAAARRSSPDAAADQDGRPRCATLSRSWQFGAACESRLRHRRGRRWPWI